MKLRMEKTGTSLIRQSRKESLFDNAKLAAELTRIVKDPMDAQHLNIDSMRFVKDETGSSLK